MGRAIVYDKPHLTYEAQLALLMNRGLACADEVAAVDLLMTVGYYRLSAYVYPFRELLPDGERQKESPTHYRTDTIRAGTCFEHVEALWRFDRKLRLSCLDAVETVEIGLRTKIAHVLGRRSGFGHVTRESLDADACRAPSRRRDSSGELVDRDEFGEWMLRYEALQREARNEDFVKHQLAKYGEPVPIWIAVEFLDLGALVRLFGLLDKRDQNEIAKSVGVSGGRLLGRWLRSINYLRNLCAHHSRLWNRTLTIKPGEFNPTQVQPDLQHAASLQPRDKLYVMLAVLAYLVRQLDSKQNWPLGMRTVVRKFPDMPGLSPIVDMGFPRGWDELPLWTMRSA